MRTLLVATLCVLSFVAVAQIKSVKSGNWSDQTTWGGRIPGEKDKVIIPAGFNVVFDMQTTNIAGLDVEGSLDFSSSQSAMLQSSKNVVVKGLLKMRPESISVIHTLRFIGVVESKFVGGGHDVMDSDVGLWVMGSGQLELVGTEKSKGWTNAQASISKGSNSVLLKDAVDWQVGDDIAITPTEAPTSSTYETSFDELQIQSISGSQITTTTSTKFNHPAVRNRWTAEVLNLTRNVRIEGTASGRSHMLIRSMKPQLIKWVQFRYVGPRKNRNGDTIHDMIPGRYGVHFHHSMDGSRGSIIESNVVRDCGNHAYVPHTSHGIVFKGNISYNTLETPFWWDPGHTTHDITYDGNVAAKVTYVWRAAGLSGSGVTYGSEGFTLGLGQNNVAINNVVVGQQSKRTDMLGAYVWQADNEGMWEFKNNIAHNGTTGMRIWQNTGQPHVVENFDAYYNKLALFHGAYLNSFRYVGGVFYGSPIELRAGAGAPLALRFENMELDGAGIINSPLVLGHGKLFPGRPTLFRNIKFSNYLKAAVSYQAASDSKAKIVDFVNCDLGNRDFEFPKVMISNDVIRVQPELGRPFEIRKTGRKYINEFAPKVWGEGNGFATEFFSKIDLTGSIQKKIEPVAMLTNLSTWLPYQIVDRITFSARYEAKLMPQFTEGYKIHLESGGGHRVWLDGKLIFDHWAEKYTRTYVSPVIQLEAGKKYDLKLEYFNSKTTQSKIDLRWSSLRTPIEIIPQSQLYAEPITEMNMGGGSGDVVHNHVKSEGTAFEKTPETLSTEFSVFPVPSTGSVTLSSKGDQLKNARIEVINGAGSKVYEHQNYSDKLLKLNLSHLKNGVYFIWVKGTAKPLMQRIVIQR